jgi:hypothetical protein
LADMSSVRHPHNQRGGDAAYGEVSRSGSSVGNDLMDCIVGAFDEDQFVDGRFDKFILGGVAGWPAAKSSTQVSRPIYPAPPGHDYLHSNSSSRLTITADNSAILHSSPLVLSHAS